MTDRPTEGRKRRANMSGKVEPDTIKGCLGAIAVALIRISDGLYEVAAAIREQPSN